MRSYADIDFQEATYGEAACKEAEGLPGNSCRASQALGSAPGSPHTQGQLIPKCNPLKLFCGYAKDGSPFFGNLIAFGFVSHSLQ
ncbi:MAG: hypothetical protein Nkreftii_002286 [Candidatus Nitrospira kreftii]|uniref:Uncharacterized protein n=1 Tax=Candidatus Nitrospira kreftii TaxID=2652173 RepID=A0A7S8FEQ2_9BACT|nr:MAG: hypothetical protein Nkreftii_002286 [Candidatus Nitrospira kreftii]